ncbi:MAG: hypothetical protein IPL50_12425 [Chitinophagaceae bacterium]|nr:hypothetical protein [Chitinophagaceae bacterium]
MLFTGSTVFAQSFYEMSFYFKDIDNPKNIIRYQAFFLLNDDGTGMMRIRYIDPKPENDWLLDCELTQGFAMDKKNQYDYSKMYYAGKNLIAIAGDVKGEDFPPIYFWFKYNGANDEYEPWAVMSKDEKEKWVEGVIEGRIRLLGDEDLTENLILTYFTKEEEIYKNLFATNIRALTPEEKKSKMYFLVVADTDDEQIGPDCLKDKEKQLAYFKKIADKLEIGFIPSELSGKELNRNKLLQRIDAINPTKNDIVIFHYSGHGYSKNDNREFPI